ncbi:hypothetical protein B0H11DRAFT_1901695 [Mycena galericulata]|nr:hypothetical protein B0H11DRAFT_1901695 [Mycena galericulata]
MASPSLKKISTLEFKISNVRSIRPTKYTCIPQNPGTENEDERAAELVFFSVRKEEPKLFGLAWPNGLRPLAEFEFGGAGVDGVACDVAWLVLGYTEFSHCREDCVKGDRTTLIYISQLAMPNITSLSFVYGLSPSETPSHPHAHANAHAYIAPTNRSQVQ